MAEKELLREYRAKGDLQVLGELYAPYMSLLYGVCNKYLQDQQASQDAVMEIFEQLIEKLRIHEVENFKAWLYVYARNFCLMELRRQKNRHFVEIEDYLMEGDGPMEEANDDRWEEADFVKMESCLATLSEGQALCVKMFYLEQKCYKDIASATGLDLKQVKSNIQNGRRNLKICMEGKGHGK